MKSAKETKGHEQKQTITKAKMHKSKRAKAPRNTQAKKRWLKANKKTKT